MYNQQNVYSSSIGGDAYANLAPSVELLFRSNGIITPLVEFTLFSRRGHDHRSRTNGHRNGSPTADASGSGNGECLGRDSPRGRRQQLEWIQRRWVQLCGHDTKGGLCVAPVPCKGASRRPASQAPEAE